MFTSRVTVGIALLVMGILGAPQAMAQSSTSILRYDDKGRVISREETKPVPAPAAKTPQSKPRPPGTVREEPTSPDKDDADAYEPGEVVVVDPPPGFMRAMRQEGFALIERIELEALQMTVMRLRTPPGVTVPQALESIHARYPTVVSGANHLFRPGAGAVDQEGNYGRQTFGWGDVAETCGAGLRIGMIDTLADLKHPALRGKNIARRSFLPKKTRAGKADHGTGVAAILVGSDGGGQWNGLLPGAALYAANIFSATRDGGIKASLGSMMKALDWLATKKVQVINISLAGSENKVLSLLMERTSAKGIVVVAAAGNGGAKAKPAFPAAHPKVLAVTAIDQKLAPYSHANQGNYIDFAAPGVALWTAINGGGGLQSGTSFAAPFISAAVALKISGGASPDAASLRRVLRQIAKDLGTPGRDAVFGWGLVRVRPDC